jgi:DNA-binding CsgD family transcriptional regulator
MAPIAARDTAGRIVSTWTASDDSVLRARFEAGDFDSEVAEALGRTAAEVKARRGSLGLSRKHTPGRPPAPAFGQGRAYSPYWTHTRVVKALKAYANTHPGRLPRGTPAWDEITRGNADLPVSETILKYFGALGLAWRDVLGETAARARVERQWVRYTERENDLIESLAGKVSMSEIALRLGRTPASVKMHAQRMGIDASSNLEWWNVMDVAREYGCPHGRVRKLIRDGVIPARLVLNGTRYEIDPADLQKVAHLLRPVTKKARPAADVITRVPQRAGGILMRAA